ncbi:hypothetical protein BQ8794_280119 [Mesorhizobium prunaredense]|uniref:Uncharacterized protein n=1 Tax=Mesorhizobium prunaredense TaxID=1631249 RepID=A0A1R3VDB5_9HYPH|nr:hypothetical protein BQ8794_280119 [Mesorhizobium prunaredense]
MQVILALLPYCLIPLFPYSPIPLGRERLRVTPLFGRYGNTWVPVVLVHLGRHCRGAQPWTILRPCPGIGSSADEMVAFSLARGHCLQRPVPAVCRHWRATRPGRDRLFGTARLDAAQ